MRKDENSKEDGESSQDWCREMADRYQDEMKEFREKREQSENLYSRWIIFSSLTGVVFILSFSREFYSQLAGYEELFLLPAGFLAVLAFAGAVGIVRWALFDLISGINALR